MFAQKKNNVVKKVAVGTAVAAVAGYVAGILTAPKSGKETRQDIKNKAGEAKTEAEQQLHKASEELAEALKQAKATTANLSSKAKDEFNEAVIRARDAQSKAASVLKAVRAGGADDPALNKAVKQAQQAKKNLSKFLKS